VCGVRAHGDRCSRAVVGCIAGLLRPIAGSWLELCWASRVSCRRGREGGLLLRVVSGTSLSGPGWVCSVAVLARCALVLRARLRLCGVCRVAWRLLGGPASVG